MNDDNGYIILQQLVDSDKSKENDVYMSPDEMYEFSESYGDNYVELIQGFTDKYYDSEASNENATKLLNIFYDEGIIKKKTQTRTNTLRILYYLREVVNRIIQEMSIPHKV